MPLPKARKGSGKRARQNVVSAVMHELKHSGTKRPRRQMVAIAMKQAGLSKRRRKK